MSQKYVYIQTEPARETGSGYALFTVGFYDPDGKFHPESDHGGKTGKGDAASRAAWLNGSMVVEASLDPGLKHSEVMRWLRDYKIPKDEGEMLYYATIKLFPDMKEEDVFNCLACLTRFPWGTWQDSFRKLLDSSESSGGSYRVAIEMLRDKFRAWGWDCPDPEKRR